MNQGGYYGAYRQGFKTLPDDAYNMMTAPTRQLAQTIGQVAGAVGGAVGASQAAKAGTEAFKQGSAAQFESLKSLSQATGTPMNPVLADQYMNIGNMSPQQQAVFNQSLGQEAQNMMARYNINQAQARAAQAQQAQGMQRNVSAGLGTVPAPDPSRYGVGPAIKMSGSLPLPVQNTGPRVNFPQYNYGQY
jgi:hypothetical protein